MVYLAIAVLNYSIVQSMAGSVASSYFSEQWGGKVKIGSMGCNPFSHLRLRNVELISPTEDTICMAHTISMRFKKFPADNHGLTFSHVMLRDVRYHLKIDSTGINLKYIIDSFKKEDKKENKKEKTEFKIIVDVLRLDGVTYIQDLKQKSGHEYDGVGVDVPHMVWKDINARFVNVRVDATGGPHISCRIDRFGTTEKSGLEVKQLKGNAYVTQSGISITNWLLETGSSHLEGDVLLDFTSFKSMKTFLDSVFFTVHFNEGSYGGMQDAGYWAHKLWGMDEVVRLSGDFSGPISDFYADGVNIAFGDESRLEFDCNICGLPKIDNTVISCKLSSLHVTYDDLKAVKHPTDIAIKAENILKKLEWIDLKAGFVGGLKDFHAKLEGNSKIGNIEGDFAMSMSEKKDISYAGHIISEGMEVGEIVKNGWISRGGFDIEFEGRGTKLATMRTTATGNLHHLTVRGQRLMGEVAMDMRIADSTAIADITLDDAIAALNIHTEIQQRRIGRVYSADVEAERLDMKRLSIWKDTIDKKALIDAKLHCRYIESGEGNSLARITADKVHLKTTTKEYSTQGLKIGLRERNHWKDLTIESEVMAAQLRGYYNYSSIGQIFDKFVNDFVPENLTDEERKKSDGRKDYAAIADAQFEMDIEWKDRTGLLETFVPKLRLAQGTTIQANYNYAESMKPLIRSDSIGWGTIMLYNVGINGEAMAEQYRMRVTSDEIMLGKVKMSENTDMRVEMSHDGATCRLYWENSSRAVGGGDVNLRLAVDSMRTLLVVDNSNLALGGIQWHLEERGEGSYFENGKYVIDRLSLVSDSQSVVFNASRRGRVDDEMQLELHNFGLSTVNTIMSAKEISLSGTADGTVSMGGLSDVPYMNADLEVKNLIFINEPLGDAFIRSTWNREMNQLNMHLTTERDDESPLTATGYVTLGGNEAEIDMEIAIENLSMKVLQPFVSSFSSKVGGKISGEIKVDGTLQEPIADGYIAVDEGQMKVDFVNVEYSFSDTIEVHSSKVKLNDFRIKDSEGGEISVDGSIEKEEKNGIAMDLAVQSDKLLCMNTSQYGNLASNEQPTFYGTIMAAVSGTVKGVLNDIYVTLDAKTLKGSSLNIPLSDKKEIRSAEYITFVSDDRDDERDAMQMQVTNTHNTDAYSEKPHSAYHLLINIAATPDMEMQIPLSTSTIDADIKARGAGDLQLQIGNDRPFTLIGDYELNSGTVAMKLLGIRNWDFNIENGSSINFPGAIGDARFSIAAIYSQRVNMSSLTGSLSSTDSHKQIVVENVISFDGTIQNPDIKFDLRLPNADQSVQEEVFAYIDRSNERDMLNQTVSLLLLGRFYNSSVASDAASTNVADEGYGLVANSLGAVVTNMVHVVDVNFDYKAGNSMTTDQVAVDISKEWNKFYFETTLGFGGEAREMNSVGTTNNMTGDMLVGYKINPRLHLFVFNRSNTNDYTRSDLPYKQGVGIKYTRDFDNWKELFRKKH